MVKQYQFNNGINFDVEELLSCSRCFYRSIVSGNNFCNYFQTEIPEGYDWGADCSRFTPVYDFSYKLEQGEAEEKRLDNFFSKWFSIVKANQVQQRQGIDRIFYRNSSEGNVAVQYKSDFQASKTGNIFVEVMSSWEDSAPGWAWRCFADVLVYFLPEAEKAYIVPVNSFKNPDLPPFLLFWASQYSWRSINNKNQGSTWTTQGILVPCSEFQKISSKILHVK